MKRITIFAIAALSLALDSCNKEQAQPGKENIEKVYMTLNASVDETKAAMNDAWRFSFDEGDNISLTNNQETAGTYYPLTRDSQGNFTGEVVAPSSDAIWYAYYPSSNVSLVGQSGTQTGTAAKCALAGKTESVVPAGSTDLNMTLYFQTSILKIVTTKGAIDINIKISDEEWVSGLEAVVEDAATFSIATSSKKVTLFTAPEAGTYYVVVPAGVYIAIYDGDTLIKKTKNAGLVAGKYYTIEIVKGSLPAGSLPGVFTVNDPDGVPNNGDETKVHFSKGNLRATGSTLFRTFAFESNQYLRRTTWSTSDMGHFFWSKSSSVACAQKYSDTAKSTDVFFTNETKTTAKADFTVNGVTGEYRALSDAEWAYLLNTRTVNGGKGEGYSYTLNIIYSGIRGLVIYPDDYNGLELNVDEEYTDGTFPVDCVFLPQTSCRNDNNTSIYTFSVNNGMYWSASPNPNGGSSSVSYAFGVNIVLNTTQPKIIVNATTSSRKQAWAVRLVTNVQ